MSIYDIIEKYNFDIDYDEGFVGDGYEVDFYRRDNLLISKASFGDFTCCINNIETEFDKFIEHLKCVYPEVL